MSNPIVYSPYTLPQPSNSLACSLSIWKHGFEFIYPMPEHSNLMHEPVFQKLNFSDFPILVKQSYYSIIPQTQIYTEDSVITLLDFSLFFDRNNEVKPTIPSDQLKCSNFILSIQSIFKQSFLNFPSIGIATLLSPLTFTLKRKSNLPCSKTLTTRN